MIEEIEVTEVGEDGIRMYSFGPYGFGPFKFKLWLFDYTQIEHKDGVLWSVGVDRYRPLKRTYEEVVGVFLTDHDYYVV